MRKSTSYLYVLDLILVVNLNKVELLAHLVMIKIRNNFSRIDNHSLRHLNSIFMIFYDSRIFLGVRLFDLVYFALLVLFYKPRSL